MCHISFQLEQISKSLSPKASAAFPGSLSDIRSLAFLSLRWSKKRSTSIWTSSISGSWISVVNNTSGHPTGLISLALDPFLFVPATVKHSYNLLGTEIFKMAVPCQATWQQPLANIKGRLFIQTNHTLDYEQLPLEYSPLLFVSAFLIHPLLPTSAAASVHLLSFNNFNDINLNSSPRVRLVSASHIERTNIFFQSKPLLPQKISPFFDSRRFLY